MNIRIGNDITLNIALSANELLGRPILGASAYLIHDISESNVLSSKSDILSDYMIHGCGAPHYFGGVGAYPHDRGFNVCGHHNHLKKYPLHVDILFNTQLRCRFLKEFQTALGDYRLVVDVAVKECCGRKVYTYDFGEVFCLTNDENDRSGDVVVDLPNDKDEVVAIEPISTIITIPSGASLNIGDIDFYGRKYGFKILTKHSASVEYHPNGSFENVTFSSRNTELVTIDENGTVTVAETEESTNVVIDVVDTGDEGVETQMVVHIVGCESHEADIMYTTQVFDPITEESQNDINSKFKSDIENIEQEIYIINNKEDETKEGLPIVVTTQAQYDEWLEQGKIQKGVFYYIYDEIDDPDNPDIPDPENPDQPDDPDVPTPTGDVYVLNHVLYVPGSVSGRVLTISGTVNNHTLIL